MTSPNHKFISYVREDERIIDFFCKVFERNQVHYWRDSNDLPGGGRWKTIISNAIKQGSHFVPLFTKNYVEKQSSVANEELLIAIEQLRLMPHDRRWFIPVKIDDCEIPDRPIGGGETIRDLQWIDFPSLGWRKGMTKLLEALEVKNCLVEHGEPLGSGLSSIVKIKGGKLTYRGSQPQVSGFDGMIMTVVGGWATRENNMGIAINLKTQAPFAQMQTTNSRLGLSDIFAFCDDEYLHSSNQMENEFSGRRDLVFQEGEELWHVSIGTFTVPFDLPVKTSFTAKGHLIGDTLLGTFRAELQITSPNFNQSQSQWGDFEIQLDLE